MKNKNCRFTVEFPEQINSVIESLAKKEGLSKVVILRNAIALYDYIQKELANKHTLAIIEGDKIIKELVIT